MKHPPIDSQITFLYTHDLAQTARFYEDVMGLQLKLDQGACRIYQVATDSYIGFCQRSDKAPSSQEPQRMTLTLVTENVNDWHRYLSDRGVQLEKPPAINPDFGIYHFYLRDPDGHLLEIQQFLDPF